LDCGEHHRFEVQANLWAKLKTFKKGVTSGIFFQSPSTQRKTHLQPQSGDARRTPKFLRNPTIAGAAFGLR